MKNFTFLKIKNKEFDTESWWACKIETVEEFEAFLKIRNNSLLNSYYHLKDMVNRGVLGHRSSEELCIEFAILSKKTKSKSIAGDITAYADKLLSPYITLFVKGNILLVNKNFGFTILDDSIDILETKTRKIWVFPDEDKLNNKIKIIQWRGCKHYYAKVGKLDVVIDGEQKWNTKTQAMQKAEEFNKLIKEE